MAQRRDTTSWFTIWSVVQTAAGSARWWSAVSLISAGIMAFVTRHAMNPDGLSYLDLASAAARRGPGHLINGYWSPGYPALIALGLAALNPSPSQEIPLIHFLNFLIFAIALGAFSVLNRYWVAAGARDAPSDSGRTRLLTAVGYSVFLWFTLRYSPPEYVTPDLCVAVSVFLAAGIVHRLSLPNASSSHYATLGFVLGAGYYFKAAALPLGVMLLAILFLSPDRRTGLVRRKLLLSGAVFLAVCAPLVGVVSARAHHPSIGEAGRLNYYWYVDGFVWIPGIRVPEHPAPKLIEKPLTLAFSPGIGGTYPLWYDPAYWYANARTTVDARRQVIAIRRNLDAYEKIFFESIAFSAGALVLAIFAFGRRARPDFAIDMWWQVGWPLAACAMYAVVYIEARFVAALLVLFWLAVYQCLLRRVPRLVGMLVCVAVLLVVMLPLGRDVASNAVDAIREVIHPEVPEYEAAGLALHQLGLRDGDQVAVVGFGFDSYYARFARLRVSAQIPDVTEFWESNPADLIALTNRLTSIGVRAIVARHRTGLTSPGWKTIGTSLGPTYDVLMLNNAEQIRVEPMITPTRRSIRETPRKPEGSRGVS